MKHTLKIYTILPVLLAFAGAAVAQTHYVGLSPKIGYSALFDNHFDPSKTVEGFDVRTIGGVNAGLSIFYELEYDAFHFQTGLDFDFINSTTRLNDFTVERSMQPGVAQPALGGNYDGMIYRHNFLGWKETRNTGYVQIPVLFGAQYEKVFFLVGPKVAIPMAGGYSSKGNMDVIGYNPKAMGLLEDMDNHGLALHEQGPYKGKLHLKPTVSLAAEVGIDLDQWLAAPPPRRKRGQRAKKTFKQCLHYRASVFADYAFLNTNAYDKYDAHADLALFNEGQEPIEASHYTPLTGANTLLQTQGAADKKNGSNFALNPFTIGVKFTVMYEFQKPKKKPAPKPKPQPKPQPKQPKPKPQPPAPKFYLCGVAQDKETMAYLTDVNVEIYDELGETTLFTSALDSTKSSFSTKLESGTYMGYIRKQGYLPYSGVFTFEKDTVHFFLQEIKEKVVTLLDVHFATNKTIVLPESEPILEDLYDFLAENPTVRIRIVGHTDAIGSDAANQRLSDGRAASVVNEMVKRGIDRSRLESLGMGESQPIDTNDTEEGRANNRRVEFIILSK